MITLKNIKKNYTLGGNTFQVLKGVDLTIESGDFLSIMGPSGSGKSTLMNIIGMLDVPSEGQYIFEGKDISGISESKLAKIRGKNIGFIFQSYNLIPRMNVLHQVMLPLAYGGFSKSIQKQKALQALKRVGLVDKIYNKPTELSGGQQQRVSIARALAIEPSIILADEPTGALDTQTGKDIMELLKALNQEGKTIILITHEPEIDTYASKHIFIKDGLLA